MMQVQYTLSQSEQGKLPAQLHVLPLALGHA